MTTVNRVIACSAAIALVVGVAWYGIKGNPSRPASPAVVESPPGPSSERIPAQGKPAVATDVAESIPWARADSQSAGRWFSALRARAEGGDVVAQRDLAEIYQRCSVYSLSPANMYSTLDAYARMRGAADNAYDDIKKRFAAGCSEVNGGQVILKDDYDRWFELAASQGDPYSKVVVASHNWSSLKSSDYRTLARDVVHSADPEALFALGDLLALAPEDAELAEFKAATGGPYSSYAWGIVACRLGASCSAGSYRMDSLCINTGNCGAGDFEDAIRTNMVPAGQQEALDRAIGEVQRIVGKKPS